MTNNPTIDGVSPAKTCCGSCPAGCVIHAGAPAVERQEPKASQVPVLRAMAANYRNGHSWDFLDGEVVSKAADEITALQSTIAQLQARVAELESGTGEPVAAQWRCRPARKELPSYKEGCDFGPWHQTEANRVDHKRLRYLDSVGYEVEYRLLYTAPPAPVAQQLGEPTAYLRNEGTPNNLVVCPFDHPDAFKVYRVPPAPVAVVLPERMTREKALELTDYPPESAMYWYNKALDDVNACLDATAALNEVKK